MSGFFRRQRRADRIQGRVSRTEQARFTHHVDVITGISVFPDATQIATCSRDKTICVLHLESGECTGTFRGHTLGVCGVEVLNDEVMISVGEDKQAILWDIDNKRCMQNILLPSKWNAVRKLSETKLLITSGRYILIYTVNSTFSACTLSRRIHLPAILVHATAVHGGHIACGGEGGVSMISSAAPYRTLASIPLLGAVHAVALSGRYLASGDSTGQVCMFDTTDFKHVRTLKPHTQGITSLFLTNNSTFLLSSSSDSSVCVSSTATSTTHWRTKFSSAVDSLCLLPDRSLLLGTKAGGTATQPTQPMMCLVYTPADTAQLLGMDRPVHDTLKQLSHLPPLQKGLSRAIIGELAPSQACRDLISYGACSKSFEEWLSAHKLLMMAVIDKEIDGHTDHDGHLCYWYETLYLAISDIALSSEIDVNVAKKCFRCARHHGVIETTEGLIGLVHIQKTLLKQTSSLHRAGMLLYERLTQTQGQTERLHAAFRQYTRTRRYSALVALALQLLPVAGGVAAGAVTAGAELCAGLSVGDVTEHALGLGLEVFHETGYGDAVISRALHLVRDSADARTRLACMDADALCEMLRAGMRSEERAHAALPPVVVPVGDADEVGMHDAAGMHDGAVATEMHMASAPDGREWQAAHGGTMECSAQTLAQQLAAGMTDGGRVRAARSYARALHRVLAREHVDVRLLRARSPVRAKLVALLDKELPAGLPLGDAERLAELLETT